MSCRYSWRVPNGFSGKFQVKWQSNFGPFQVTQDETWYTVSN
jgi:hypothetical protein